MTQTNFKRIDELPETTSILSTDWLPMSDINNLTKKVSIGTLVNLVPGSTGIPGGSDTLIQYNDGGSFGGDVTLYFNDSSKTLYATNFIGNGSGVTNVAALTAATAAYATDSDLWDNHQFADYLDQSVKTTTYPSFVGLTLSTNPSIIRSTYSIQMSPSGDTSNKIKFQTIGGIPEITTESTQSILKINATPSTEYPYAGEILIDNSFLFLGTAVPTYNVPPIAGNFYVRDMEVIQHFYLGGDLYAYTGNLYFFNNNTETGAGILPDYTLAQMLFTLGSVGGRQLVFCDNILVHKDFDHEVQTNPTIFIHSATDPDTDNTQYGSFYHDQTDFNIFSGTGSINIIPSGESDDYLKFTNGWGAWGNSPTIKRIGGHDIYIQSDHANIVQLELVKDNPYNYIHFWFSDATTPHLARIATSGMLQIMVTDGYDNYLTINTIGNQTTLNWVAQNGRITADSGTINFDNENLTTTGTISGVNVTSGVDPGHTHTGGAAYMDDLLDADTTTDSPVTNEVLKWNGLNWVPAVYDYSFVFSVASFADNQAATQLIGSGTWMAIAGITFTISYNNGPPDSATINVSGTGVSWVSPLTLVSPFTSGASAETTAYPSAKDTTVTFTITAIKGSTTDNDNTTTVIFRNNIKWGESTEASGWDSADITGLSQTSLSATYTGNFTGIVCTTGEYILFAHPSSYTSIHATGFLFNSIACPFQAAATVSVTNSAGFTENYKVYRSTNTNLGTSTLVTSTSSNLINPFYYGGSTKATGFTEADVEGLTDVEAPVTNDTTQTWNTVTLAANEYFVFAYPSRLTDPTNWYDNTTGFALALYASSPETVSITNANGYTENYDVWRSENILGPGTFTLRTS